MGREAGLVDPLSATMDGLSTIAGMLEVDRFRLGEWDRASARFFALDCASIVYRHLLPDLDDGSRDLIQRLLHEARRLTVDDREAELGSIERALTAGLYACSTITRPVWLASLNAILPDPFRAAQTAAEAALQAFGKAPNPRRDAVADSMRRRLHSRTEEAALLRPTGGGGGLPIAVA